MRIIIWLVFLTGCATTVTPLQQYQAEMQGYGASVWPSTGLAVPIPEYWAASAGIAKKHGREREWGLFMMLGWEAEKQRIGLANDHDRLSAKYFAGDVSVFNDAERFFLTVAAENQCRGFGYVDSTGDFNKCVFDVRLKLFGQRIQVEQLVQQMMAQNRPAPIRLPTQTKCTTSGNQTNCTSQ